MRTKGQRVTELDQVHIPDPVFRELRKLHKKVDKLSKQVEAMESEETEQDIKTDKENR